MDETALIKFAIKGDLDAFNRLVLAYQDVAFNTAYRLLGDPALAEDATQDAFFSAYKHLSGFKGGSFKAWVLRIVTNACYDEMRRQKRRPTTQLEPQTADDEEMETPIWLADNSNSPEDNVERNELDHAIQHCLGTLAPDFRAVVILVDVQGLDYEEVSTSVGSPLGTIKSRLARARVKMRDCLQGFGELLPSFYRYKSEDTE